MSGRPTRVRATTLSVCLLLGLACGSAALAALDWSKLRAVAVQRFGEAGREAASDWLRLIELARGETPDTQLSRINAFFNLRTAFDSDAAIWQQSDYWATPLETLARGRGDCEDFAIAKYVSLRVLGIPSNKLRLIYVRADLSAYGGARSQAHMVLGYYPDPAREPKILDNLVGEIEWASARTDLTPVFSFNDQGLWAGSERAPGDPTQRLSRWRDLLARLRQEGWQ